MVDGYVSWEDTVNPAGCNTNDPVNYVKSSRDPERTPFQWNSEKNAGIELFYFIILYILLMSTKSKLYKTVYQ